MILTDILISKIQGFFFIHAKDEFLQPLKISYLLIILSYFPIKDKNISLLEVGHYML